ncbi:MAG TPA: hypothetical protein VGB14_13330 [Acidimicrobiales bacterium]|jgi:hypothetical protein
MTVLDRPDTDSLLGEATVAAYYQLAADIGRGHGRLRDRFDEAMAGDFLS